LALVYGGLRPTTRQLLYVPQTATTSLYQSTPVNTSSGVVRAL